MKAKELGKHFPSQNALKYVIHQLKAMQHGTEKSAIVLKRAGDNNSAVSLRLAAEQLRQVAVFLEGWILEPAKTRCKVKGRKCK